MNPTCRAHVAAMAPESFTATEGEAELTADFESANGGDHGAAAQLTAETEKRTAATRRDQRLLLAERTRLELDPRIFMNNTLRVIRTCSPVLGNH